MPCNGMYSTSESSIAMHYQGPVSIPSRLALCVISGPIRQQLRLVDFDVAHAAATHDQLNALSERSKNRPQLSRSILSLDWTAFHFTGYYDLLYGYFFRTYILYQLLRNIKITLSVSKIASL